jgi:hypothetical protein
VRYLDHHLFDSNRLLATHEQATHPNDNPIPNKYGKLTNIQTGRLCQRRRLDTEASRLIVRRIRFGTKEGAEVEAAGVSAHFWEGIKNHKTIDYGTGRLARCYQLLARYHQHKVCLWVSGRQCALGRQLLLTPMAVEEYGN